MRRAAFAIGYIWALPLTLAGALVSLFSLSGVVRFEGGAALVAARSWLYWLMLKLRMRAFCWGGVVVSREAPFLTNEEIVSHELRHFQQARWMGVFLPVVYVACSVIAWAEGGQLYQDNALEIDARRAGAMKR